MRFSTTLNEYADNQISQRISTLPGVAQMLVFGSQKYAVRLYHRYGSPTEGLVSDVKTLLKG